MRWKIAKIGDDQTIAFAAEELRHYMMQMDKQAEIAILAFGSYITGLKDVLWLGVDDELVSWVEDPKLDDAFLIDVQRRNGRILGSNPRSVLFGVYRFLKEAGCAWIRPGKDGEVIPKRCMDDICVSLREKASYRHRGICIEGSISYEHISDMIDWMPKACYNAYFNQFNIPVTFYNRWYDHQDNPLLKGEPLTSAEVAALRDQTVVEIKKRGLIYHVAGHGWTCEPFGIPGEAWEPREYDIPSESVELLALVNGKRELWGNVPLNTNLCYSNPVVREKIVNAVVQRCKDIPEIDYVQVWLADGTNNHCECDSCRRMRPSDWYVTLLNEIDAALTKARLDTKVVFLLYVDLLWEPQQVRLNNPDRFTLMFAPITRTYTSSFTDCEEFNEEDLPDFELNKLKFPESVAENLAWMRRWRKQFQGDGFDYDYHFMWDHFTDPGYYEQARILFKDMQSLHSVGLNGMISCQNQRVFFPNGLGMIAMAEALWNENSIFDAVAKDYFQNAYGADGESVRAYLKAITDAVDPAYIRGEKGIENKEAAESLARVPAILDSFIPRIQESIADHALSDNIRASWQYLAYHSELCRLFALTFQRKAEGKMEEAKEAKERAKDYAWRHEPELHHVLDSYEFQLSIERYFEKHW